MRKYISKQILNQPRIFPSDYDTIEALIFKEIPNTKFRKRFWLLCTQTARLKSTYEGLYYYLTNDYDQNVEFKDDRTIDVDMHRTFPHKSFFQNTDNQARLRRILRAFIRRNPSIGYIQGFNFIAGRLLEIIDDEVL